jgi:hypothetical protein
MPERCYLDSRSAGAHDRFPISDPRDLSATPRRWDGAWLDAKRRVLNIIFVVNPEILTSVTEFQLLSVFPWPTIRTCWASMASKA